jgi:hypothetical protein
MKVARLSALCTGLLYPQRRSMVLISVKRLCRPQDHSAAKRITSIKTFKDHNENRTRNLQSCSAVNQSTALLRPVTCVKLKFALEQATKSQRWSRGSSILSLTSALDKGGWLTPRPGRFTPRGTRACIYCVAGWVGPRAGLEAKTCVRTLLRAILFTNAGPSSI